MPCWLQAYICQKHDDGKTVTITVNDLIHNLNWDIVAPTSELISEHHMWSKWLLDDAVADVQCNLALQLKYLDCSITPSTPVSVLWEEDGKTYTAKVMAWKAVERRKLKHCYSSSQGPHISVLWDEENSFSICSVVECAIAAKSKSP
jgi:hypothetical protein